MTESVGAIGYGKLLLRSMSAACKLAVTENELSSMQGIAILQGTQRGVFVNVSKASGTDNTAKNQTAGN